MQILCGLIDLVWRDEASDKLRPSGVAKVDDADLVTACTWANLPNWFSNLERKVGVAKQNLTNRLMN